MAPESYYDQIVAEFRRRGLNLLGRVRITTDDAPYHVEVDYARSTHLSFRAPNKCFCLQLNHSESEKDGVYRESWRLNVDLEYASFQRFCEVHNVDPMDDQAQPYRKRPSLVSFEPFGGSFQNLQVTWTYEQIGVRMTPTLAPLLVHEIFAAFHAMIRGAKPNRFEYLLCSWAPTYTFSGPDQRKRDEQARVTTSLFWERFGNDRRKLRALSRITP